MKRRILIVLLTLGLASAVSATFAEGNPEAGRTLAETCMGCHGVKGYFNVYPSYRVPKLGGQNALYIASALQAYKKGLRRHDTMQANAANLSDEDIADIAAYLQGLGR